MRIWCFVLDFLDGNQQWAAVALAIVFLTIFSAMFGGVLKSMGLYVALCLLFSSVGVLIFLLGGMDREKLSMLFAVEGGLVGFGYAILYILLAVGRKIDDRKAQRRERQRRLQFTLPDYENSYLRDRLHTALRTEKEELYGGKRSDLAKMGYAKKLLANIKEVTLSPVERMDVEEMASLLLTYDKKEKWSSSDVKTMSEIFSRLLKLAAKYDVAV